MVQSDGATCLAGAWASADSLPTAQSVTIPEGVLQISPASTSTELTTLQDDGLLNGFRRPTTSRAGPGAGDRGGGRRRTGQDDQHRCAQRLRRGLHRGIDPGFEELGGTVGEAVLYDPEQPSFNSEAQQITSGNPDGIAIIDFPETFEKVGPALERTGAWDPNKAYITDGLASGDLVEALDPLMNGFRGTAPARRRPEPHRRH